MYSVTQMKKGAEFDDDKIEMLENTLQ